MGISIKRFTADAKLLEPFLCGICNKVMENPHSACRKDHVFCKQCLDNQTKNQCHTCKRDSDNPTKNVWLARTISQLESVCKYQYEGCEFVGPYHSQIAHREGSSNSYKEGCPFRRFECPNCQNHLQARHVSDHIDKSCPNIAVYCENRAKGCGSKIMRRNIPDHLRSSCNFVACGRTHDLADVFNNKFTFRCHFLGNARQARNHQECQQLVENMRNTSRDFKSKLEITEQRGRYHEGEARRLSEELNSVRTAAEMVRNQFQEQINHLHAQLALQQDENIALRTELDEAKAATVPTTVKDEDELPPSFSKRPRRSCTQNPKQY